jgi:hypothetical protein
MAFEEACTLRGSQTPADMKLNYESYKSIPYFKSMAKAGLLTTDSQEGRVHKFKGEAIDNFLHYDVRRDLHMSKDDLWQPEYARRGGELGDGMTMEKAYVTGFMLKAHAERVTYAFNMMSDKLAVVVDVARDVQFSDIEYSIPVTFKRFDCGALTRLTRAWTWQGERDMERELELADLGLEDEMERLSMVLFLDTRAGRRAKKKNGLYADIMKALEHDGEVRG